VPAPGMPPPPTLSAQQPITARLTTPTYDGSTDPLSWLSRLQLLFKLHNVPDDQQVRYAAFHLTGAAQL
jgi:hypothetical protein